MKRSLIYKSIYFKKRQNNCLCLSLYFTFLTVKFLSNFSHHLIFYSLIHFEEKKRLILNCFVLTKDLRKNEFYIAKGPFPLRAWKRAFFVSFIDLRLKRAVKIEASAKKNQ